MNPAQGVSVVIPTYDRPAMAASLVLSLLSQRDVNLPLEILVVNDNGNSEVYAAVRNVATDAARIVRCFDTGYGGYGPGLARNVGIRFARYQTLVFFDDDMSVADDIISRFLSAPTGLRLGRVEFRVEIDGEPQWFPDRRGELMEGKDRRITEIESYLGFLWGASFSVDTVIARKVGGFDEIYLDEGEEDVDFGARVMMLLGAFVSVPSARAVHNGPDLNLAAKLGLTSVARHAKAHERLCSRRGFSVNGGMSYWLEERWENMLR